MPSCGAFAFYVRTLNEREKPAHFGGDASLFSKAKKADANVPHCVM